MLSIRFDDDCEWWAPVGAFERLFVSALEHGRLIPALEEWQHIAAANGGFSLVDADVAVSHALRAGLHDEAHAELERMARENGPDEDAAYHVSLERLLALLGDAQSGWGTR